MVGAGAPRAADATRARPGLDLATLLGLASALALVAAAMAHSGRAHAFVDPAALLIVLGGTAAVTMVSFSLREVLATPRVLRKAVLAERQDLGEVAQQLVGLADLARREGPLRLEEQARALGGRLLLLRGVMMAVDGVAEIDIERALAREFDAMLRRHRQAAGVLRRAAETAPAMGLIGTLIGLVQMLGQLDDPSRIGPAMAVALLTTLYGAMLAHMVFTPLAVKLERASAREALAGEIDMLAVLAVRRRLHPRQLEAAINGLLPPRLRRERLG